MILVLDASAAVKLTMGEPDSALVRAMVGATPVVAPDLVLAEVGNTVWRKVRQGVLEAADARAPSRAAVNIGRPHAPR